MVTLSILLCILGNTSPELVILFRLIFSLIYFFLAKTLTLLPSLLENKVASVTHMIVSFQRDTGYTKHLFIDIKLQTLINFLDEPFHIDYALFKQRTRTIKLFLFSNISWFIYQDSYLQAIFRFQELIIYIFSQVINLTIK